MKVSHKQRIEWNYQNEVDNRIKQENHVQQNTFTCSVCGYDKMKHPPANYTICSCCGTEFGYDDATLSHSELRQQWIDGGCKWWSSRNPQPIDFNPTKQLQNTEFAEHDSLYQNGKRKDELMQETKQKVYIVVGGWDYEGWDYPDSVWVNKVDAETRTKQRYNVHNYNYVEVVERELN